MNKQELIEGLMDSGEFASKAAADRALAAMIRTISKGLQKPGDKVRVSDLGTFEVKRSKARNGRHPITGEPLKIKAKNSVKFRPSRNLLW